MNLALDGGEFFQVKDRAGRTYLTRRGELVVDAEGRLATPHGEVFLDQAGQPIPVGNARELRVASTGQINGIVDGQDTELGVLSTVAVKDPAELKPVGSSLYLDRPGAASQPARAATIRQGYVEESNVDVLKELVRMIGVQRSFQATTRALGSVGRMQETFVQAMW
jgi:flagellar basal-body rod protein FlgG